MKKDVMIVTGAGQISMAIARRTGFGKNGDTAVLTGQSYVDAAVFGGGRSNWHLQQKCSLKKISFEWKITRSVASTY